MREKLKTVGVVSFFAFSFLSLSLAGARARKETCVSLVKVDVVTHNKIVCLFFSSFFSPRSKTQGGTPEGVILEDEKTLEQCGIHRSMGVFEYLWVDSKENQEKYKEEKERMFKIIPNHEKFMEEYAKENPGRGDFDALDDEILERGAPNKDSKLLQKNNRDEEYFKDAHEIQAKVEKELDEYNAKEDEERKKIFGDDGDGREKEESKM